MCFFFRSPRLSRIRRTKSCGHRWRSCDWPTRRLAGTTTPRTRRAWPLRTLKMPRDLDLCTLCDLSIIIHGSTKTKDVCAPFWYTSVTHCKEIKLKHHLGWLHVRNRMSIAATLLSYILLHPLSSPTLTLIANLNGTKIMKNAHHCTGSHELIYTRQQPCGN